MRRSFNLIGMLLIGSLAFNSCDQESEAPDTLVPTDVLTQLTDLGFDVTNQAPMKFESGYLVEGDIYLTDHDLSVMKKGARVPEAEQYSTNNLVSGLPRNISVFIPNSGSGSFSATYVAALDTAIARYNAEGLRITFSRTTTRSGANIVFSRLPWYYEWQGVLGSAGFPTSSGNPYGSIQMSGILQSRYGLGVTGIATIMAHEMGHCIGFRHTDYYDRSVSCGGSVSNEGAGSDGANHIPGTPTNATAAAKSWMLACTDGSDRPFNSDDKVALDFLY